MTSARFVEAQELIGWSNRQLAGMLRVDERMVRRWRNDGASIPKPVAAWLDVLARAHAANPPPDDNRD